MRLDLLLQRLHPNESRTFWKRAIELGKIKVDGKVARKAHAQVSENAKLDIESSRITQTAVPLPPWKILFDDPLCCVIDKPPNLRVEDIVAGHTGWLLVHRLDKDTSGILVLAKSESACGTLQEQWKERTVQKTYIALVKGRVHPAQGAIEAAIERSSKDRRKMTVSSAAKARPSLTEYKVLQPLNNSTLLEAYPRTGRTHQIRVHFSVIHHPIIGDRLYGDKKTNAEFSRYGLERQFLHAARLSFTHPKTKKPLHFESGLPTDLQKVLDNIEQSS